MASLINSIRSILGEPFWAIKIIFFAAILFSIMDNDLNYENGNPKLIPLYIALLIILLGYSSIIVNRHVRNLIPLFPNFTDAIDIVRNAFKSIVVITPGALIYYFAMNFLLNYMVVSSPIFLVILVVLTTIFFSPLICIPFVLYSVNGKILEGFHLHNFNLSAGNFIVQILSYIIQYIFTIALVTYLLYTLFVEMLGDHPSLLVLKCIVIIFSFFSFVIYCADMYDDVIPKLKKKRPQLKG